MVFEDETGFTLHPRLGRGWARRGQRLRVPTTSQHHTRLNCFGWVAPMLKRWRVLRTARGNQAGFVTCLRQVMRQLRWYTVWLYVDGAPWHRGPEVEAFLHAHPRLHVEYLPRYQPGLNVQERIWRQVRYEATTNQWFTDLGQTWQAVHRTITSWTPAKLGRLCNIT